MAAVITLEGVRVKAKPIPKEEIVSLWKTLTKKAFPRVKAFQLRAKDFENMVALSKTRADEARERQEWGRVLSPQSTDAIVFNSDEFPDVDYLILIRENPHHDLESILKHELSHIARGDL